MRDIKNLICKNCKYKIKDEIHGHGEYYGSCRALKYICEKTNNSPFDAICSDNDTCIIQRYLLCCENKVDES